MMNRRDAIKAVMAMPAVAAISTATLEPDDVIVVEIEKFTYLSDEASDRIRQQIQAVWPNRRVIVLDGGVTMRVVRAVDAT